MVTRDKHTSLIYHCKMTMSKSLAVLASGSASVVEQSTHHPKFRASNPAAPDTSGLYYKSFMVVIYDYNDSTIVWLVLKN